MRLKTNVITLMKKPNEHRNASNQLTFDFSEIEANKYNEITKSIIGKFKLEAENEPIVGLDEMFQKFRSQNKIVNLEWDNWSGYIVSSENKHSEELAIEIANYIYLNC